MSRETTTEKKCRRFQYVTGVFFSCFSFAFLVMCRVCRSCGAIHLSNYTNATQLWVFDGLEIAPHESEKKSNNKNRREENGYLEVSSHRISSQRLLLMNLKKKLEIAPHESEKKGVAMSQQNCRPRFP
ncbi:hypothetical protein P8452_33289 [Trifolium repens]|nr:hypothetical protein P8452_33289 [Trifolium repens]